MRPRTSSRSNAVSLHCAGRRHHLEVAKRGSGLVCTLNDGPLVSGHRPSVDACSVRWRVSVAPNAVGAILTGMGRTGPTGLLAMRKAGCHTLGQDEGTALVYGMPRVAWEIGAVECPGDGLFDITKAILNACAGKHAPALASAGHP